MWGWVWGACSGPRRAPGACVRVSSRGRLSAGGALAPPAVYIYVYHHLIVNQSTYIITSIRTLSPDRSSVYVYYHLIVYKCVPCTHALKCLPGVVRRRGGLSRRLRIFPPISIRISSHIRILSPISVRILSHILSVYVYHQVSVYVYYRTYHEYTYVIA